MNKFSSLAWCSFGEGRGIVGGGMVDGAISLWDVATILGDTEGSNLNACLSLQNIHDGKKVNSLQFNPFKPNLLASGGSEVFVQNIEKNIKDPELFKPGHPNHHGDSPITCVSWNKKVVHILASSSENGENLRILRFYLPIGLTVVWDLKTTKPIFNFSDPNLNYDAFYGDQANDR
jgi:protein transport protein SEC31